MLSEGKFLVLLVFNVKYDLIRDITRDWQKLLGSNINSEIISRMLPNKKYAICTYALQLFL
jgi:hypothetical protein